jgi:hypothetical protein
MKSNLLELAFGYGGKAARHFHAEDVSGEQVAARESDMCRHGERARQCTCCGVDGARQVGIVVIDSVYEYPVHQCRIAKRQSRGHADHFRFALAQAAQRGERAMCEFIIRGGVRDAYGVEHEVLGTLAHRGRYRVESEVAGEL